jgi:Dolichyl-phosphate-mannose-protein mannosyltransferase
MASAYVYMERFVLTSERAKIEFERPSHWTRDRFLLTSLLLGLLFCLYGMHWGVAESWHADQYVLRNLLREDELPFHPPSYLRPPFHLYLSFFLVRVPVYLVSEALGVSDHYRRIVELIGARLLTAALFLGQIVIVFIVSQRFFGSVAARATSLLLATSAGFIAFSHFLTVDIPATFWMLLAFLNSQNILLRGRMRDYVLAGLFTGVATATKYNALAIGISIPVAHWLASNGQFLTRDWTVWKRRLFDTRLVIGICVVVFGFVLANPFAVLDYSNFVNDLMYNVVWVQYHEGPEVQSGYSYWLFLERFGELFGVPAAIFIAIGAVFALLRLFGRRPRRLEVDGLIMLGAVLALYYAYFGSFGRLPARFVLPVAPYWLMIVGPLCAVLRLRYLAPPLAAVVVYNMICSVSVGWRFTHDPRMAARAWINDHIAKGSSVEYTSYTPNPARFPDKQFQAVVMPRISGRVRLFNDILADDSLVTGRISRFEGNDSNVEWYTADALATRSPDYIWIVSDYYERFFSDVLKDYYPGLRQYFADLLEEKLNYAIAYDAATPEVPWWIYPQEIDALGNRITILQRRTQPPSGGPGP